MKNYSRRNFLQTVGIGTLSTSIYQKPHEVKKIKVALVGLGRYAEYMASQMKDCQYCEFAGLVTGTPANAESWGKEYNIPIKNRYNYQNFDEIKNNPDIDLVYVILPNSMHKEFAIRAAKAKKHVLVEKPMPLNAAECEEMIKACKKKLCVSRNGLSPAF